MCASNYQFRLGRQDRVHTNSSSMGQFCEYQSWVFESKPKYNRYANLLVFAFTRNNQRQTIAELCNSLRFPFFFLPFGVCWWSHVRTQPAHQLNRHTTQTKAKQNNVYVRYKNRSLMSLFECWSAWSCARECISVLLTDLVYRRVDISTAMFHCRYLSFTLAVAMFSLAVCHFSVKI